MNVLMNFLMFEIEKRGKLKMKDEENENLHEFTLVYNCQKPIFCLKMVDNVYENFEVNN